MFAVIALTAYVIDMVTKVVAVDTLQDRDISVVGDLLVLNLVRNPGAAFSVGTEYTVALSCISIGALVAIVWLSRRIGEVWWAVGMGLLLAGVAGNLTDRILRDPGPLRGHVIDFLQIPNWPVFNVADMCVVGAAGLIIVQSFRGLRLNGTRIEP
nr:signal peptidase II [Nocardioides sp. zg-DK7169]